MLDKPEEFIVAVLLGLWVILTYFVSAYTGASIKYILLITGFTTIWAVASFWLWQVGKMGVVYPWILGALVACWWSWLDWYALRGVAQTPDVVMVKLPWYASWWFKLTLAALPVVACYAQQWRSRQKPRFN